MVTGIAGVVGLGVVVGLGGLGGLGVGVGVVATGKLNSYNILLILFFIILPLVNSIFDYLSMYFSRYFASKILETDKKLVILLDLIYDFLIAIVLLFILSFTLFFITDITNTFIIKDEARFIPIETYKTQILNNPFDKDILWITLMFISTLIPTFLHFLLATYAIMASFAIKPHLHTLSDELKTLLPNDPDCLKKEEIAKSLVHYRISGVIKWHIFFMILDFIFCCLAIVLIMMTKGIYF
jgi:phosphatidylglycerophosphatase A